MSACPRLARLSSMQSDQSLSLIETMTSGASLASDEVSGGYAWRNGEWFARRSSTSKRAVTVAGPREVHRRDANPMD